MQLPPAAALVRKITASLWLLVAGIAILGYCAYVWLDARYPRNKERSFEEIQAQRTAACSRPSIPHAVLGKIEIQQVGIAAMIAEARILAR